MIAMIGYSPSCWLKIVGTDSPVTSDQGSVLRSFRVHLANGCLRAAQTPAPSVSRCQLALVPADKARVTPWAADRSTSPLVTVQAPVAGAASDRGEAACSGKRTTD